LIFIFSFTHLKFSDCFKIKNQTKKILTNQLPKRTLAGSTARNVLPRKTGYLYRLPQKRGE